MIQRTLASCPSFPYLCPCIGAPSYLFDLMCVHRSVSFSSVSIGMCYDFICIHIDFICVNIDLDFIYAARVFSTLHTCQKPSQRDIHMSAVILPKAVSRVPSLARI